MIKIAQTQHIILRIFMEKGTFSSSGVHAEMIKMGNEISLITIKRELSDLKSKGFLNVSGAGRSVVYGITSKGRLVSIIDAEQYASVDPDKRFGLHGYEFLLFESANLDFFSLSEVAALNAATEKYRTNTSDLSPLLNDKELERFIIELSWKSSKIEGNTYTLLDTENLIKYGIEAPGHDKDEAQMILNHKEAFKFIREQGYMFKNLTLAAIEEIHRILVKDLNVNRGVRSKPVGVVGSVYRPLDNSHQIREALQSLVICIKKIESPYAKAMMAVLGLSYIQPFEDGNKRTSRLVANAILLAYDCAPLSYRSVDENAYREAMLVFYELNSISSFKKIFLEQYDFAARNYAGK